VHVPRLKYNGDRERIIVSEIPYQVNKALMIERTAELVNEKEDRRYFGHP
jgi:DNA gyrase/topoisomerase IV subunit A